ncbi:uncharacterized protein N7479_009509 [Penicillium vulpinum]|uniref:Uncharacterized protein n=1 Tax=Penicillium vulpinum TaxID=29845 RepID=A0A1V6RZ39_9EURO|nr:uncharacterized protein N7479_009509 [Penicillium vulpinum]KAJ5951096.1 hypothetical protein N7479_009509 [Penicillium vulpinum]OQE06779.1 hypothetical protein PENVUL_c016G08594 [Penicillium vulpinum]
MAFWVDWELWEKLSVVLAMLIGLVLLYAFCVLGWNRWMMSKYAAAEAKQREHEAEVYPMLHKDDIPFGARALERGVEVEGIWVSDPNTPMQSPCQPATPAGSRPVSPALRSLHKTIDTPRSSVGSQSSMISPKPIPPAARRAVVSELDLASAGFTYETQRPSALYSRASLPIAQNAMRMSPAQEEALVGMKDTTVSEKRASFPTRLFGTTSNLDTKHYRVGLDGTNDDMDNVPAMSSSSSGISSETKRSSQSTKRPRRRSSEEFRRRMSQIFNDNIQMGVPAEQLEFNPALRQYQRRFRKSMLRPFRPWANSPVNES